MSRNFRRLKEEADISRVVDYCGIQRGRRIGSAQFVTCPNPEHDDRHPTNAYYRDGWNTIFCTTCNKNMEAIDIIMWQLGVSFEEAANILWELEGEPDWYQEKNNRKGKHSFMISISELELIGIQIPSYVYIPIRYSEYQEYKPDKIPAGYLYQYTGSGYLLVKRVRTDWKDYLSEKDMVSAVLMNARKRLAEYDQIELMLGQADLFIEERQKISELIKRAKERGRV